MTLFSEPASGTARTYDLVDVHQVLWSTLDHDVVMSGRSKVNILAPGNATPVLTLEEERGWWVLEDDRDVVLAEFRPGTRPEVIAERVFELLTAGAR